VQPNILEPPTTSAFPELLVDAAAADGAKGDLGDRCYDFLNIFAENFCEKIGVFWLKTKLNFEKVDHNIGI
jgi:hypothetical protein